MQVKDQIDDLRCGHALFDVARQGHLVDTALLRHVLQVVFESELGRLELDAKICGYHDGARGQTREGLDAGLAFHVHGAR